MNLPFALCTLRRSMKNALVATVSALATAVAASRGLLLDKCPRFPQTAQSVWLSNLAFS